MAALGGHIAARVAVTKDQNKSVGNVLEQKARPTYTPSRTRRITNRIMTVLSGIDHDGEREEKRIEEEIARHEQGVGDQSIESAHGGSLNCAALEAELAAEIAVAHDLATIFSEKCRDITTSRPFHSFINVMIVINAVQMGLQSEPHGETVGTFFMLCEHYFTAVFTIEMALLVYVMRTQYFSSMWNLLDCGIVWISIFSAWVMPLIGSDENGMSTVKVLRLLRLLRILRLMKAIPELRMVLEGMVASLKAIIWVVVLLFLVIYAFSIFAVEMVGQASAGYPGFDDTNEGIKASMTYQSFNNFEYFGSLTRSLVTLLSLSLLVEWDAVRPIWEAQPFMILMFFILIFISSFGIINVIIGVICESTNASMQNLAQNNESRLRLEQMRNIRLMTDIVWSADADNDGEITYDEMQQTAEDPDILRELRSLGLPKGFTFDDFHTMLNLDGQDGLSKAEFNDGMHRLIFSTDFQKTCLMQLGIGQVKVMSQQLAQLHRSTIQAEFRKMRKQLRRTKKKLISEISRTKTARRRPDVEPAASGQSEEDIKDVELESDDSFSSDSAAERKVASKVERQTPERISIAPTELQHQQSRDLRRKTAKVKGSFLPGFQKEPDLYKLIAPQKGAPDLSGQNQRSNSSCTLPTPQVVASNSQAVSEFGRATDPAEDDSIEQPRETRLVTLSDARGRLPG